MRVLIVDCRAQSTRGRILRKLLCEAGHRVRLVTEIGGRRHSKANARKTAAEVDAVLLHASAEQSLAHWALTDPECCRDKPALLFSGGSVPAELAREAESNPRQACLPFAVPLDPDPEWAASTGRRIPEILAALVSGSSRPVPEGAGGNALDATLDRLYAILGAPLDEPGLLERALAARRNLLDDDP
jgi:hypothetical protein